MPSKQCESDDCSAKVKNRNGKYCENCNQNRSTLTSEDTETDTGGNHDHKVKNDTEPITNVNNTEMPGQSANLSNDMKIMMGFFTTYFDGMKAEFIQQFESLENSLISSLDQRISEAVGAAVKQEIGTVKADFDKKWSDVAKRLDNMEGEWRNYKQTVENKISNLPKQQQNDDGVDKTVTLVIRNLPEEVGEDINSENHV